MKIITPIKIWKDGKNFDATILDVRGSNDNLKDSAKFIYSLYNVDADNNLEIITEGVFIMIGKDYDEYIDNEKPYTVAAEKFGLEIIGEYLPKENI